MVTEDKVSKALIYLAQTDEEFAKARGLVTSLQAKEKTVLATEFLKSDGPVAEREAKARTSEAYKEWLTAHENAVYDYETMRVKRTTGATIIDVWRTLEASRRANG